MLDRLAGLLPRRTAQTAHYLQRVQAAVHQRVQLRTREMVQLSMRRILKHLQPLAQQQLEQSVGAAYMDAGSRDKAAVRSEVSLSPPGARTRLGDVTRLAVASTIIEEACSRISGPGPIESIADVAFPGHYDQAMLPQLAIPVSYTHLTLPTILLV